MTPVAPHGVFGSSTNMHVFVLPELLNAHVGA